MVADPQACRRRRSPSAYSVLDFGRGAPFLVVLRLFTLCWGALYPGDTQKTDFGGTCTRCVPDEESHGLIPSKKLEAVATQKVKFRRLLGSRNPRRSENVPAKPRRLCGSTRLNSLFHLLPVDGQKRRRRLLPPAGRKPRREVVRSQGQASVFKCPRHAVNVPYGNLVITIDERQDESQDRTKKSAHQREK